MGISMKTTSGKILASDSVEKFVTLSNPAGNSDLNAVTLTTTSPTPATPNPLTTDTTNGLQLTIESCTAAWTVVANGADTCAGSTTVLAKTSIIGANRALAGLASLTAAGADNLKVTTSLPATAGNTFQGLTSTINFTFDATQRTGTVK